MKTKSMLVILILAIMIPAAVYSQYAPSSETWMMGGFEYGLFWESAESNIGVKSNSHLQSLGMNLTNYGFWGGSSLGFFSNLSVLFPSKLSTEINGVTTNVDYSNVDYKMQLGACMGVGYRLDITRGLTFKCGIGPSFFYLTQMGSISTITTYNLGIGGEVGLKYDITKTFFVDLGTKYGFDFANYTKISTAFIDASDWAKKYFLFRLNPTISIGLNIFR